jgi:hypothetical protein
MKLKELFNALACNGQRVEVYFTQENLDFEFGFKINGIDSRSLKPDAGDLTNLIGLISDTLGSQFLNHDLLERQEGDTSYWVKANGSAIRDAQYFDWTIGGDRIWFEEKHHQFMFPNIDLDLISLILYKDGSRVSVRESAVLQKVISKEQYNLFVEFYCNLLAEFQVIEAYLTVYSEDGNTYSEIEGLKGWYSLEVDFTLLDEAELELEKNSVVKLLTECFDLQLDSVKSIF